MPAFTRSSRFQTFTVSEKEAANALLELKRGMNVQTSIATTRPRRACTVGVSYAEDEEEFQQAPSSRPRRACTVGVSYAEDEEEFQQASSSRPRRACAQY